MKSNYVKLNAAQLEHIQFVIERIDTKLFLEQRKELDQVIRNLDEIGEFAVVPALEGIQNFLDTIYDTIVPE